MGRLLDAIKGHDKIINDALDAIARGRLAPTLLFVGPEGVGKRQVALGLAQALVCETSRTACGTCGPCLRAEKGSSESLLVIQPLGAQIKVEQTRQIQDWISFKSLRKSRVVIINDAEKLNPQSANSLLKTLEEPPPDTYFFLIAPSQSSVLTTIRSRSQILRFGTLSKAELATLNNEKYQEWALASAQGQASRLAVLSNPELDELRKKVFQVFISTSGENLSWAFLQLKELAEDRETALQITVFWQQFVRDLFFKHQDIQPLIHGDLDYSPLSGLSDETLENLSTLSLQAERDIRSNVDRILSLENLWKNTHQEAIS